MERLLTGLVGFSIKPTNLEVTYNQDTLCPNCGSTHKRIKASFWRKIKSIPQLGNPVTLHVRCNKFHCKKCGRYFNTRINGVKKWNRSTEPLKNSVFSTSNRWHTNRDIALESGISVASVERFFHQMVDLKVRHRSNRLCPRFLGIDEHRFTKKVGFATTFCNLEKHSVFDIAVGRSEAELLPFLRSLKGRERVKVVCMDMYSPYRVMVRKWFPNAKVISDRFHVIKLINHHFSKTCKIIDEESLSWGRGGLIRAMSTKPQNLSSKRKEALTRYFEKQPIVKSLWEFWQELTELCRHTGNNKSACSKLVKDLLEKIEILKTTPFRPLQALSKSLKAWLNPIGRMFRYNRSNGVVEGFHRKMKLIQRRAYGFRNFENYRMRVKVLCG